jgi:hypothetical protein
LNTLNRCVASCVKIEGIGHLIASADGVLELFLLE